MKTKVIFTLAAVIYLIRGIGLLASPAALYGFYGATLDAVGVWSSHFMGATMIFIALINWVAGRNAGNPMLRGILATDIIFELIGTSVACAGAKIFNSMLWVAVGMDTLLLILFIYLFVSGTEKEA